MNNARDRRTSNSTLRRKFARAWSALMIPLLRFLARCREHYRERQELERNEVETAQIRVVRDDTIWHLRRWEQITHWRAIRHGSSTVHALAA